MRNWRNHGLSIGVGIGLLLAGGQAVYSYYAPEPVADPNAWAIEARDTAEVVPFSKLRGALMASGPEDRAMIFTDKVVFEDRMADAAGPSQLLSAELNYNAADPFWADISEIDAAVSFGRVHQGGFSMSVLIDFLLIGIMLLIFIPLLLRMSGLKDKFGGPAQLVKTKDLTVTLDDVAGLDLARDQFREIVGLIKSNGKIGEIGARPPKGVILQGPPGTGKTLLARAMAKEAGVSFLSINASRLHETFIGVGPKRVEDAFEKARKNAPCIIFIDEVDAVGSRSDGGGRSDQERSNLINTFLQQMDGLTPSSGIFIVGATNRPDKIDPAFMRPGRIDRKLTIGLPDRKARQEILELHAKKLPVDASYDFGALAGTTPGMSGAELATLVNEAGIAAGRDGAKQVGAAHFAHARQKMMLGESGSVTALSDEEREVTAWHEAGHAIAATLLPHADPVEHATILPHGGSLGHVLQVPEGDRHMTSRASLMDRMTVLAAGRAAEMHKFGPDMVTNGAASDIDALTKIATAMVTQWGMGRFGFLKVDQLPGTTYPDVAMKEIRILARDALDSASKLLEREADALAALSAALMERDMLSGAEIRAIITAHARVESDDLELVG